jgi:hypothetical protein
VHKLVPTRAALAAGALAVGIAVLPGAPAAALDAAKPAAGCAGLAFSDPTGDAVTDALGLGIGPQGPPNIDITGGFFRYDGATLTANIQIADLDDSVSGIGGEWNGRDVSGGLTGLNYYFFYTASGKSRFVTAVKSGESFSYHYGTFDDSTGVFTVEGPTKGKIFAGPDGIIQMEVPAAAGGAPGTILGSPFAEADNRVAVLVSPADTAPDSRHGESYTVGQCVEGATAGVQQARPQLSLRAPSVLGSARRANARKSISFKVRATKPITDLRVVLRRADGRGKALASGRLKRLSGVGTIRLRLLRPVKAGTYSLQSSGVIDGVRARRTQRVRLAS